MYEPVDIDELEEALSYVSPEHYEYQDWLHVGMALKEAGADLSVWERWSANDPDSYRRDPAACAAKWDTFDSSEITAKTIFKWAMDAGWKSSKGYSGPDTALDWESVITSPVKVNMSGEMPVQEPQQWNQFDQVRRYIKALFHADEYVAFNTNLKYDEARGKWKPADMGTFTRTAGQILEDLDKYEASGDLSNVLGTLNPDGGAYIRINPVDGKGVNDRNVTRYSYALIESDNMPIEQQRFMMHALKLPIRVMVHSAGKSVHAIVKVDAKNRYEFKERVEYLHAICNEAGLIADAANKNEARLSRLPGVYRKGKKQYIIEENVGLSSWDEWYEYQESLRDKLPKTESMEDLYNDPPEVAPELIGGVLRQGHKMIISGPSKAGKSFLLLELAYAIAEGHTWIGNKCKMGKVLYVNMEIDRASFARRFISIYNARKMNYGAHRSNIDIWNLRGYSMPITKLIEPLLRRAKKEAYSAIIIDPLYKVLEGDENSNTDVARMGAGFDRIAQETGASVIYVHHFAKGYAGDRSSIDRGSGAGTFSRDPDAILTISPLEQTEDEEEAHGSAWRVEYTLREFKDHEPTNVYFQYPVHEVDDGLLKTKAIQSALSADRARRSEAAMSEFKMNIKEVAEVCDQLDGGYEVKALAETYSSMFEEINSNVMAKRLAKAGFQKKSLGRGKSNIWFIE